jgi:restriction endonuclease S subunit
LENYVLWAVRSPYVKSQITKVSTGSTFKEIKIGSLRQIKIPVPIDRSRVNAITNTLNNTQTVLDVLTNHIKISKKLKSKHMNQLLG